MKLTAKKLKQLIIEELQEAHMGSYGPKGGPRDPEITAPLDRDVYMRRDPNFKPTDYGDYEPDPDYDEVAAQAKALLAVIDLVPEIVTDDPAVAEKMKEMAPQHADKIKLK